jgi:hypothetical protein
MEDDSVTLRQTLESVNSHKWIKVMDEEIKSMYDKKSGISSLYLKV